MIPYFSYVILNSICRDSNLIPVQYLENRIPEEVTYYELSLRKFMNEYLACDWVTDHYLCRRAKGILLCRELVVLSGVSSDMKTMMWRSRLSQPSFHSLTHFLAHPIDWLTHTCCCLLSLSCSFPLILYPMSLLIISFELHYNAGIGITVFSRVSGRGSLCPFPNWWACL